MKSVRSLLFLSAILVGACSSAPNAPSAVPATLSNGGGDGAVSSQAITIERMRLRRVGGNDIVTGLATGQVIDAPVNVDLDIWAEIRRLESDRARLVVDWGNGNVDSSGCGACRLVNRYTRDGRYTVVARVVDLDAAPGNNTILSATVTLNVYDFDRFEPIVFNQISTPDAAYLSGTTKIDFSALANATPVSSISNGALTVTFSGGVSFLKGSVPGGGWGTWSAPPFSESGTPAVLYDYAASGGTLSLSAPVSTFGFELEPNPFSLQAFTVQFLIMSGSRVVGQIPLVVNGSSGARLFAASVSGAKFDKIVIVGPGPIGFGIAQVRYRP